MLVPSFINFCRILILNSLISLLSFGTTLKQTAKDCLSNAAVVVRVLSICLQIEMPYACIGAVVNLIARLKGKVLSMDQDEKVRVVVRIRSSMVSSLEDGIRAISGDIVTGISK